MVVSSLGGCSPTAGPALGRQGRTQSSQASPLRLGLNAQGNRRCICGGDRHAVTLTRRAYTLTSDTTVTGSEVRSADLNDMCTLQLGMLYQLLSRTGNNYSSMRCTVYARNFTSVGPGQVKLVRVAQFPVSPGQGDDMQSQQQLLLHTEQSWALQGGSAAVDPSAMIEDCLRHREVVALPSSSCLVFPLVDCGVLVGLLVVEMQPELETDSHHWEQHRDNRDRDRLREAPVGQQQQQQQQEVAVGAQLSGGGGGGGGAAPGVALPAGLGGSDALGGGMAAAAPSSSSSSSSLLEWGSLQALPRRSLTDEELQCLRLAVPLLAKACGMDARASWQLAQSSVSAAAARGLLREAQRPLSTLNTFGAMLLPRLKDGDPDKDMAKGILVQGKRLQDLMWQLEDALHGPSAAASASLPPPPGGPGPAGSGVAQQQPPSMSVAMPGLAAGAAVALPAPPFRSPSALPRDPSPAVQELLSLPPPRPAALPPAASQQQQQPPTFGADASASSASTDDASAEGLAAAGPRPGTTQGPPPVSPGRVTFVDRSADAATANSGGGGGAVTDAFTIRQPPVQPSSPVSVSGRGGPGSVAQPGILVRPPGSHHHQHREQHHQQGASTATIDVEMEPHCDSRGKPSLALAERPRGGAPHPGGGAAAWGWGPAHVNGSAAGGQLTAAVSTNLASAMAGVLTAAYRLAAVSGIGFIVNSPLSAVLPRRLAGGAAAGKPRPPAPAGDAARQEELAAAACDVDAAASSSSAGAGPRLIPRPARPLLVGVHGALVQKVVGYMLDIALQCTPRGGQVCVSARQDGAGVQVQLLHSGRMDLQRLHVRSRSLAHHHTTATTASAATTPSQHVAAAAAAAAYPAVAGGSRGGEAGAATALATRPAASGGGGGGGGGAQAGSGVLSVEIAQELAQQAGGHLTVSYPFNMVNAQSGTLDVGTSVEIWLPGPGALN
ncbi:hypothetical protein PLESTB_001473800 [Pleodorina starrii]|uniref:Uncharacterized protein n=1 Tax=Pleodorina starrii TaxID=330485 RepID=A0A9W6BW36_9CHLO|nr:hypothetical protein PLESTM_000645200 [Pleodorina starrii]GLC59319.1 hypothetical protein PLESTB_001473800 [Pleodorina starrii]GLC74482.1 hypothetical protein PLESTF_001517500 [Pleodorina starrii]